MKLAHGLRRRVGHERERLAGRFLEARGVTVLHYNYQCRAGEIDLVARELRCLLFVEVKFRSSVAFGEPEAMVTAGKQRRIIRCARHYLAHNSESARNDCRFDVIAITPDGIQDRFRIKWIRHAFQLSL